MRKLNEIATDLRGLLLPAFQTVRISALQNSDQLLKEIKAINPDKLPGVIIIFDGLKYQGMDMTVDGQVTLLLVDQFRAGSDDRALSLFQAGSGLMALFPSDGRELNGVWYYPEDCVIASSQDGQFAALAIGLAVKQGAV